jgi:outer membrane protein TolC
LLKEIGRSHFSPVRVRGVLEVSDAVLSKPDFEALAEKNPSLGKLLAQKNAASFGIKAALANYFPEITAQAGAGKTGISWPPEYSTWNTGVSLSMPVLEGGLRAAQVAEARARMRQAEADERSARDGLVVTLQETWAALQDAVETVQVRKKFLDAAEERSRIAEAQYSIGMITYDNWTIIEDNLVSSKTALLEAQANALLAEAAWVQAKGETLEYEK